ncbi:unnamed protein product (macronuclear) [Paramecium tetraurelia]|uniref:Uncharacterized protein n=1 Tax=Paramecium tetraurelia TaxID=5888 RepID=A0BIF2_PARTE|nr:uncharacterized protein GSPATT00004691001 [Paramecium tetraurelia]CAK58319.1 unnamed protein product [Paramecium tetraurelia]|eukprot:XP_001425717.1 hypothetical protein (macronuclear) [Paramecium tetraurelia strain d4-2]
MGSSLCFQDSQKSTNELKLRCSKQYKLNGPPHLFKPTPIVSVLMFDEQIEKEESPQTEILESLNNIQNVQQFSYMAQQSEEIDSTQSKPWIKKTYAIQTINVSNFKNDENNNKNNNYQLRNSSREQNISSGKYKNLKEDSNVSIQLGQSGSISINTFDKKQLKTNSQYKNK